MADAAASNDNGNGKVTLALLGQKLDALIEDVKEVKQDLKDTTKDHEHRIQCLESGQATMESKVNNWSILNSAGAIIAGILAALGLSK